MVKPNHFLYPQGLVKQNQVKNLNQLRQLPPSVKPPQKQELDARGNLLSEVVIVGSMRVSVICRIIIKLNSHQNIKMKFFLTFLLFSFSSYSFSQAPIGQIVVKTTGAKLTMDESTSSTELLKLAKGDTLSMLDIVFPSGSSSPRFKAEFNGQIGFVSEYFLEQIFTSSAGIVATKTLLDEAKRIKKLEMDSIANVEKSLKAQEMAEYMAKFEIDEEEQIRINDSIADAMLANIKSKNRAAVESDQRLRREKYVKKYGTEVGEKIAKRIIWIGMTEEMLIDSWGNPKDINSTVTRYSHRKQYVYSSNQYVYVENGVVDAWQD